MPRLPDTMSASKGSSSSSNSKACCFCHLNEDNEIEYGKIYEHNGIVTHYYCLLLSSNMEQKGADDEGILGFLEEDIQKELRRGKRLHCSYCKKLGATLGCYLSKCTKKFHLPCGLKEGSLHQYFKEFRSYCIDHRPRQKIDDQILKQIVSVDNVLCYICYDKVNTDDFVKTLWAPCCKKDAWFHRICIQQLALSAGYFFKCPLCNNKKDFQAAMLEYGIFVPSQDASWELVPNAFEELLYRHDQCDAPMCHCPKGRKHISSNAKWELALCRMCGSQGIHMACGQLKWANPVWECNECISILRKAEHERHERLSNGSARSSSSQTKDSDSNSEQDSDSNSNSDSDLDSDTDISVGTDVPLLPCSVTSNSSLRLRTSSDSKDVKLRPGPRSFKLLQQKMNKLHKRLELTNTNLETNVEASLKDTKESSDRNDEKREPSTSKENISQQKSKRDSSRKKKKEANSQKENKKDNSQTENKVDSSRKESKENNSEEQSKKDNAQKERQLSKNGGEIQSIQNEADIITIESDDDDVEFIALERKTNSPPLHKQQHTPTFKSQLNAKSDATSAEFKSKSVTIDLLNDNDVNRSTVSESEVLNKNASTSDEVDVATSIESTLDVAASKSHDLEETNEMNLSEASFMNIKITNVTSLPPEVFESVPDVCNDVTSHENTTDTSALSSNNMLEQLFTLASSAKRSIYEVNGVTDNCKKIKRNSFDGKLSEENSATNVIVTNNSNTVKNDTKDTNINNTNGQRNESISTSKIGNNKDSSKCTATTIFTPQLNNSQKNNSPPPLVAFHKANGVLENQILHLEKNGVSVNVESNDSVTQKNPDTALVTYIDKDQVYLQFPPNSSFYLQPIPSSDIKITQKGDETSTYTIPLNNVPAPHKSDNQIIKTVIVNQNVEKTNETAVYAIPSGNLIHVSESLLRNVLLNKSVKQANVIAAPVPNTIDNRVTLQKTASKENVSASTSSVGIGLSNKSYCDGDAGTRPVYPTGSISSKDGPPSESHNSAASKQEVNGSVACSVFPKVTNNHNTCHQPRLIPRYINLHDLKFKVCDSNNLQMTLYDTFSVNISMNSKKDKNRLVDVTVPQESKGSSAFASLGASCSSNHINNTSIETQRSDKLFRSLNCLINDTSTCAKYIAHGKDDTKENLDPVKSVRMLSRSGTLDNVNPMSNVDDMSVNDHFRDEDDSEMHLISSDTNNLSVLNRTICNMNVDNVTDGVTFVPNKCSDQGSRINLEDVQLKQAFVRNAFPVSAEDRSGTRLFGKETNKLVQGVDFDLNVVNMNKNVVKVSQDITVSSRYTDGDRISNHHTDDSLTLPNGYKYSDSTNVMRLNINNQNVAHVTKFNEHSILNKQIDTCNSRKFIRCMTFQENTVRCNDGTKTKSNNGCCFKVSIDLCKIQKLIDSKPELFQNYKHGDQLRARTNRLSGLNDYVRQQVRYCDIDNRDSNCLLKNKELQKSNTFLLHQKSNQEIRYFDKDILDR